MLCVVASKTLMGKFNIIPGQSAAKLGGRRKYWLRPQHSGRRQHGVGASTRRLQDGMVSPCFQAFAVLKDRNSGKDEKSIHCEKITDQGKFMVNKPKKWRKLKRFVQILQNKKEQDKSYLIFLPIKC